MRKEAFLRTAWAEDLARQVRAGDRRALARALTDLERDGQAARDLVTVMARGQKVPFIIGVSGPPGAGKSTLVGEVTAQLAVTHGKVGLLFVDPSSPITGGAMLADRVRLTPARFGDEVFARSIGSRGALGGLNETARQMTLALATWGANTIVIETVGAGQTDVAIAELADTTVVVCPPGLGDEMQAMKAGLLEIADVFVINKSDRPGADDVAAALSDAGPGGRRREPREILRTVAITGEGVDALVALLDNGRRHAVDRRPPSAALSAKAVAHRAGELVRDSLLHRPAGDLERLAGEGAEPSLDDIAWAAAGEAVREQERA